MVKLDPRRFTGWINRSFALHELKRTQEACDQLHEGLYRFRDESLIWYNLACYACVLGDKARARKMLDKAIELGGDRVKLREAQMSHNCFDRTGSPHRKAVILLQPYRLRDDTIGRHIPRFKADPRFSGQVERCLKGLFSEGAGLGQIDPFAVHLFPIAHDDLGEGQGECPGQPDLKLSAA